MDPPVVEHLRQMRRTAGLFDEPEEEVVVLTAVALRAFAAQLLIQCPLEDQMCIRDSPSSGCRDAWPGRRRCRSRS